ncbi:MAG TPA: methyltransferase domain-containing protein [Chitinophagaceae bacterium]
MPSFSKRSYKPELLDASDIPFADIKRNMEELNVINTWLGGHAITISGVKKILDQFENGKADALKNPVICEIGCGGGDNLRAISKWLKDKNIRASYIGIDINPHCIQIANTNTTMDEAVWLCSDYREVTFNNKPDIIFSSLFCHHFTDEELTGMFKWMNDNAGAGFFINDLHRHPLAYHSIKLLTAVFSRSYLVKNDAPLSVLRGFSKKELTTLMQQAGLVNCSIEWKWAFRWLVTVMIRRLAHQHT